MGRNSTLFQRQSTYVLARHTGTHVSTNNQIEAKAKIEKLKSEMAGLREELKGQSKLKKKLQNEIDY